MPAAFLAIGKWLIGPALKYILILGAIGVAWWQINDSAFNRGFAARDVEARQIIARMEERLAQRMRENEGLTDPEIDCQLRRLRNPSVKC